VAWSSIGRELIIYSSSLATVPNSIDSAVDVRLTHWTTLQLTI